MNNVRWTTVFFFSSLFLYNIYSFFTIDINSISGETWALFIFSYIIINMSINLGWHRYFCHKAFKSSKFLEYLFLIIGTASGFGPINTWIQEHKAHHKRKNNIDPFNPHNNFLSSWFWWAFNTHIDDSKKDGILTDMQYLLFQRYYFFSMLLSNLVLFTLFYILTSDTMISFFLGISLRISLFHLIYSLSHAVGHYEKFRFLEVINLGEGNHINHHKYPEKIEKSLNLLRLFRITRKH